MKTGSVKGGEEKRKKIVLLTWFDIKNLCGVDASIDI